MINLPSASQDVASSGILVAIILVIVYLVFGALAFASYILTSLSLYTIGSRRLIKNSWLSWLPIGKEYILGKIAEEYDAKNGINRKWGKIMLTLSLIGKLGLVAFFVVYIIFVIMVIGIETANLGMEAFMLSSGIGMALLFIVVYIAAIICLTALQFLTYICYFKLYESTVTEKAVKYLLISLLVPFGMPICLYRAKDKGYMNIPQFLQQPVTVANTEQPTTVVPQEVVTEPQETAAEPQEAENNATEPQEILAEQSEQPTEE